MCNLLLWLTTSNTTTNVGVLYFEKWWKKPEWDIKRTAGWSCSVFFSFSSNSLAKATWWWMLLYRTPEKFRVRPRYDYEKKHKSRDSKMRCCCCRFCCGAPTADERKHAPVLHDTSQIDYCRYRGRASLPPITSISTAEAEHQPSTWPYVRVLHFWLASGRSRVFSVAVCRLRKFKTEVERAVEHYLPLVRHGTFEDENLNTVILHISNAYQVSNKGNQNQSTQLTQPSLRHTTPPGSYRK